MYIFNEYCIWEQLTNNAIHFNKLIQVFHISQNLEIFQYYKLAKNISLKIIFQIFSLFFVYWQLKLTIEALRSRSRSRYRHDLTRRP